MSNQIQAELLIVGLIFLCSTRFLFIKRTKKDSLSLVSLVAFIFSIFYLIVFGVSFKGIYILSFSLWATIWNFRAILRLVSDVVVDRYDLKLVIISIINSIICCFMIFFIFNFKTADIQAERIEVEEIVTKYHGKNIDELSEIKLPFKTTNANIWNFESKNQNKAGRTIIIFVPPKTASVEIYRLFLQKLAKNGYSVYTGEFWTKDTKWFNAFFDLKFIRRFAFIVTHLKEENKFENICFKNKRTLIKEYEYLINLSKPTENDSVFLLTEEDKAEVVKTLTKNEKYKIDGSFDLIYFEDNSTKGFGPIENTDPFFACILGVTPDRSGYISSHFAMEITDFISNQIVNNSNQMEEAQE